METVNFWDKLYLHRSKINFLIIFLMLASHGWTQVKRKDDINLPNYDERKIHYGFTIGINSTRFRPVHSSYYVREDTVKSAVAPRSLGFSLGFVLNYKFADYFDLRLLPTVAFYDRKVVYTLANKQQVEQTTESTFIELPFMAKYKSERRGNLRFYLVGGFKPGIEAGAKKKEKKESELRTENYDLTVDYGIGADIYYPLFKFSPEIRFSHGLLNLLNNDPNVYSQSLNRLTTHTVSLFLHFE
jgi:hypothetical protein